MTLVSDIITDAYRKTNLIALGTAPTTPQVTEALRLLNRLVKSVFGNEVGEALAAFPIGRHDISRPAGFPGWDPVPPADFFLPLNTRAIINLEANVAVDIYLHPMPSAGSRFAYNFMTPTNGSTVTVHGNGRFIGGASSITLDGTSTEAEYLYRDDLSDWVVYAPLLSTDTFPFPEEFDTFFIVALAMEINPAYGVMIDQQAQAAYKRAQTQIRARYHQAVPTRSELALLRTTRTAADRDRYGNMYWFYDPSDMFAKGWPW